MLAPCMICTMYYQHINSTVYVIPPQLLVDLIGYVLEGLDNLHFRQSTVLCEIYILCMYVFLVVIVVSVNLCVSVSLMIKLIIISKPLILTINTSLCFEEVLE